MSSKNIARKSKTDVFEEELTEGRLFPDFLPGSTAWMPMTMCIATGKKKP